jgi:hypothetical protein
VEERMFFVHVTFDAVTDATVYRTVDAIPATFSLEPNQMSDRGQRQGHLHESPESGEFLHSAGR